MAKKKVTKKKCVEDSDMAKKIGMTRSGTMAVTERDAILECMYSISKLEQRIDRLVAAIHNSKSVKGM